MIHVFVQNAYFHSFLRKIEFNKIKMHKGINNKHTFQFMFRVCMTHLFIQNVFRERDAIKYKNIKAATIFRSAFQYKVLKIKMH